MLSFKAVSGVRALRDSYRDVLDPLIVKNLNDFKKQYLSWEAFQNIRFEHKSASISFSAFIILALSLINCIFISLRAHLFLHHIQYLKPEPYF